MLFENDQVRVFEFTAKPGETVTTHSHPHHFAYMLAPAVRRGGGPRVQAPGHEESR